MSYCSTFFIWVSSRRLISLCPRFAPRNSSTSELPASLGVLAICWSTSSMYWRRSAITVSLDKNVFFGGGENTTLGNFWVSLLHSSSKTSYFCGIYDDKEQKIFSLNNIILKKNIVFKSLDVRKALLTSKICQTAYSVHCSETCRSSVFQLERTLN